jgi:hypothetical protein
LKLYGGICGFTPNRLLLNIGNTALIKWAWFAFACEMLAMFTIAIFNTPMLKLIVYTFACASFMVVHNVALLNFVHEKRAGL